MRDRRFDLRVPRVDNPRVDDPRVDNVDLRWKDQDGQMQHGVGQMAEISSSGASVRAQRPLRIGTALSLGYQSAEFPGTVRHCMKRGEFYYLGIEFQAAHIHSSR